jgi:hypothetical protein
MKRAVGKSGSRLAVAAFLNYVTVALIGATAAAIAAQTVGGVIGEKLLAVAAALRRISF